MCGIIGVYSQNGIPLVPLLHDGLIMEQHRGQEGAGAVLSDREHSIKEFYGRRISKEGASVKHFFSKFDHETSNFCIGIAHTRYSTAGSSYEKLENFQPILRSTKFGTVAIVMNGNLPTYKEIKNELEADGSSFEGDSDTEIILNLVARSKKEDLVSAIIESLQKVSRAYSVIFMTKDKIIAARDPYGFRPLSIAEFDNGYIFASETCAFDAIHRDYGVRFLRDVEPGEVIVIDNDGFQSISPFKEAPKSQCIFELIYFARPDSLIFGIPVYDFRIRLGLAHAVEHPISVDCVIAIPDSSNYFGDGHAMGLEISHCRGLVRNHYSGRTFIDPTQSNRSKSVRLKINPIPGMIKGKNISMDDDSIVRGTTSRKIARMIKTCGPKSIGFSIGSPPVLHPCFFGIDTPDHKQLIAANKSEEEIRSYIGVDFLNYLPLESLKKIGGPNFCYACFDGKYPK